jgi:peptidoglycan/xylan/chitin deacetylase (PgdA/CDA1 family)
MKRFVGEVMAVPERAIERARAPFSQLAHFLAYSIKKPKMHLNQGMFIVSIDVDVGSKELGVINKGENDLNVNECKSEYRIGAIEENVLPMLVETFDNFEIPVTFAVRGQLTEVNGSVLEVLLRSAVKHDIGAHGYYHKKFTDLSHGEAEEELNMISAGLKKYGVVPRSFVFPANRVAHLDVLGTHGYKCYRGDGGGFRKDSMYIEKSSAGLCNIHPSLYLDQSIKLASLKGILDVSIAKKLPFHVWFHPWSFGETKKDLQRIMKKTFVPLFSYAKRKERSGEMSFETMFSAALTVERARSP